MLALMTEITLNFVVHCYNDNKDILFYSIKYLLKKKMQGLLRSELDFWESLNPQLVEALDFKRPSNF